MRRSRIYTPQKLATTGLVTLEGSAGHYLTRVLRAAAGDAVILFNGNGRDYAGQICEVRQQHVAVELSGSWMAENESPLRIILVQAVSKGERMDYCLQKATELGVYGIQPVFTHRTEVRLDPNRRVKRLAHWQGVVISACEQSGRAFVPEVRPPLKLREWVANANDAGNGRLLLDPGAALKLSACPISTVSVSILVGPEGGLTGEEIQGARAAGITAVCIGPRVMRTETAGPAAIVVLQAMAGDL